EESEEDGFPESFSVNVTEEREVIEVAGLDESHRAAERIGGEADVGIGEEEPLAGRGFVSLLQGMRFAEPALRKVFHMDNAETIVASRGIVEDRRGFVLRAVIDGDDFQVGIRNGR